MRLTASDFHRYYRPSKCDLRIYLTEQGIEEEPASPYEKVLLRLGMLHEQRHLGTFASCVDLRGGTEPSGSVGRGRRSTEERGLSIRVYSGRLPR